MPITDRLPQKPDAPLSCGATSLRAAGRASGRGALLRHPTGVLAMLWALAAGPVGAEAFPGAEGYGLSADGWRGGKLVAVTSLGDRGPGTLRACAEAMFPRICVFRTAGTITLNSPIMVRSDVYIAGQTAPGQGIQLRLGTSNHGPVIIKNANDVVIRFVKIRPGTGGMVSPTVDAITVENARRVYLGNLSLAYATDETLNIHVSSGTADDITLADSILAYSLDNANHPEGKHSKGALICSKEGRDYACGRISLIRNLFAHHRDRNPDLKATAIGPVEVINNIFYNPISQFGEFYDLTGDTRIAYVGNLALTGPSSNARVAAAVELFDWTNGNSIEIWAADNLAFRWKDCTGRVALPILDQAAAAHRAPEAIALTIAPMPAPSVEAALPARVGDVLPDGSHRDALDRRVLDDLRHCRGRVIDSPAQAGGWPAIPAIQAPRDSDGDLLPDIWEAGRPGLNPNRVDGAWSDGNRNGIPAVEEWLAHLAGDA